MKIYIQAALGLVVGLGLVWFLFRDTDWAEVGDAIRTIHWGWFALGQIPLWVSFLFRVQRWSYIVRAAHPVPFRDLFSATQIGFLANFTLPARMGEPIRALVLTRKTGIKFSKTFAFVALDRVTDLVGLIIVVFVAIFAFQPTEIISIPASTFGTESPIEFAPKYYRGGAIGTGVFLVAIIGAFVILFLNRSFILKISDAILGVFSKKLAIRIHGMIDHFADGLQIFQSPGDMLKSVAFSLCTWACPVLLFMCMFKAFHIECPWYTAFVMQAILSVFIAAPGTPGFIGQYHVPVVIALIMVVPDISVDLAKAYALINHFIQLPPVIALGVYFLLTDHLGLAALAKEGKQLSDEEHEDAGDT